MLWPLMNIVGPILLLIALIYVVVRTWKRRPGGETAVSDAGARRLREQLNAEDAHRQEGSR